MRYGVHRYAPAQGCICIAGLGTLGQCRGLGASVWIDMACGRWSGWGRDEGGRSSGAGISGCVWVVFGN